MKDKKTDNYRDSMATVSVKKETKVKLMERKEELHLTTTDMVEYLLTIENKDK